jgi:hypothetical protein
VTTISYDPTMGCKPSGVPEAARKPRCEVEYDRKRHVIRIEHADGKIAEFDDRPVRFLVMSRDPHTKALVPVIHNGEPMYYYLSREAEG